MSFSEWKQMSLGDVCVKITDGAHFSPKDDGNGLPMASVKDLNRFGVEVNSCRKISREDFDSLVLQGCSPNKGDVLIAKDGNTSLDTVCVFKQDDLIVLLSSVAILRPNEKLITSDFLNYYLDNPDVRKYLKENFRSGSAIPRVILRDFRKAPINVPSLDVQDKITSILRALDDKIELNRQMAQTLEAMAQALFKEMCLPKEDELLDGWKVDKIGCLFDYVIGGDWGKDDQSEDFPNQCAVIRGTDIKGISEANISKVPIRYIKSSNLKKRKLQEGDIVFEISGGSKDQATGRNLLVTNEILSLFYMDSIPASFCRLIRCRSIQGAYYLGTYLNTLYAEGGTWHYQIQSTGISNFQFGHFSENHEVVLPPKHVLLKFYGKVKSIYSLLGANLKENKALVSLRDGLLPKLMKGEIVLN